MRVSRPSTDSTAQLAWGRGCDASRGSPSCVQSSPPSATARRWCTGGAFFVVREDGAFVSVSRTGGRVPWVLVFRYGGVLIG